MIVKLDEFGRVGTALEGRGRAGPHTERKRMRLRETERKKDRVRNSFQEFMRKEQFVGQHSYINIYQTFRKLDTWL